MCSTHVRRYGIAMVLLLSVLVLGLATNVAAQAQAGTGQVVGTVYDSSGALIPQAKVTLSSKDTGLTREETAGDEGQYRFILVPVGKYTLSFSKAGFKTYKAELEVTVGAALTVNAKLELGEVSQVVEVTATALIESTQANPDSLIGVRRIEELPINGRRFTDFVSLAPTVQLEPQRTGISFAGQRGINSNVTIDGADYNEPFFGGLRGGERSGIIFTIPQEAISQFQAVSNGYSVEFGRSSGGILNATTKSGTNDLHGSVFFFARNGALAKQDAFDRDVITNLYQEGGSVGGRIYRDKAFFFAAFERQTNDIPRTVFFSQLVGQNPATNPAITEAFNFFNGQQQPYSANNNGLTGLGRLDFQPNPNHRLTVRYHYSKNTAENAVQTGNVLPSLSNRALSDEGTENDRTNTVTGQWTAIFSPRVIMETRGQYSLENRPRTANSIQAGLNTSIGVTGTRNFLPTTLDDSRVQIASNLTWTIGKHSVKFGGEYNHINAEQFFKFNQFGVFGFFSSTSNILQFFSDNHATGGNNRFDNTNISYSLNIGNGQLTTSLNQVAFFIQDQWRVTPRFTVTAGFRWEGYVNPQPDVSNTALYNQVKNFPFPIGLKVDPAFIPSNYRQYMPRLGIAWDPRGNAKTVIRANAGIFYAPTPLLLFAGALNNFRLPAGDLSVMLPFALPTGYACTQLYGASDHCNTVYSQFLHSTTPIDLNKFTLDKLPILTPQDLLNIAKGLGLTPNLFQGAAPFAIANDYASPRSWQWAVGMEHEVARGFSVGADFTYVNTVHLQRNYDPNLPAPLICTGSPLPAGCVSADLSLRPCFGVTGTSACSTSTVQRQRPIGNLPGIAIPLSNITLRESTARSFYKGMTIRSNFRRSRYQFQAYYTLSYNYSDDDNERSATGFNYDDAFDLAPEYNFSNLDTRHLFLINGLVDLPLGFTVSALSRIRSGRPVDPIIGFPVNGAEASFNSFGDRAFQAGGVPFRRNSFRDRATSDVDLRLAWDVLKLLRLNLREGVGLSFTADFFNVFNAKNIVFTGDNDGISGFNRRYGLGVGNQTSGSNNGKVIPANSTFLRLKDPSFCSKNSGCYDTNNFPGANGSIPPFTVQLGIRFQF